MLGNFFQFIIIDNINEAQKLKKFVRGEERRREENNFSTGKQGGTAQYYHFGRENSRFEPNNVTTNTCKLTNNEKIKNNDNIIIINKRKKGKKNLIGNIKYLRNFIEITKYITLLNIINNIFVNNKFSLIEFNSYNITLKIKGIGTKKIFSQITEYYPDEVYINGDKQNGNTTHSYNLNQTDNVIRLIWYNLISSCDCMFYECSNITEIDFSNFNTSNVDNMNYMFYGCSSLISLNLSNFDTSNVDNMNYMFYGCSSLTSLNLSNFDTSK